MTKTAATKTERKKPRIQEQYEKNVLPELMKEFNYKNVMQVPKLEKIVLNMGLGEAIGMPNLIQISVEEMTQIAGQKAVATRSRKSIANFKLRIGLPIGATVTLRRERMWEFFDRLVNVAIPRVRDFRGLNAKSFDGRGNYTMGLKEQVIFTEINYDRVQKVKGMNITIATTAPTDDEGRALLRKLGMPFRN